ncbi:MAG: DsbA family oxidoreductase [Pelagimonas sp.]
MTQPLRVDIISDVMCPWCIVGYSQLAKAASDADIDLDVHWHPFELNPQMAEDGENLREHLAEKYGSTPEQSTQVRAQLTNLGQALGFEFNFSDTSHMWNTFRAHQLLDWAEEQGKGHDLKMALFKAHFTDAKNLSDPNVLADVTETVGLDRAEALRLLASEERAAQVRQKQQFWQQQGIQGVPAMVFQQRHLVTGAQGEANYTNILTQLVEMSSEN